LPALAAPPREDLRRARIRTAAPARSVVDEPELQPSEAAPVAAAAADAGGVDLAGLLGMLTALAAAYVYARGQRVSLARQSVQPPAAALPPDPR